MQPATPSPGGIRPTPDLAAALVAAFRPPPPAATTRSLGESLARLRVRLSHELRRLPGSLPRANGGTLGERGTAAPGAPGTRLGAAARPSSPVRRLAGLGITYRNLPPFDREMPGGGMSGLMPRAGGAATGARTADGPRLRSAPRSAGDLDSALQMLRRQLVERAAALSPRGAAGERRAPT